MNKKINDIYQYDLPQNTLTFAGLLQWKQTYPSLMAVYSNGTHSVLADPVNEVFYTSNIPSFV